MTEDETLWPMDHELQTLSMLGASVSGRYKLQKLLGEGGMGSVYLATDELLARQVAVKVIKAGPLGGAQEGRFFREAKSLARLNHPNIVTLYDYGWHEGQSHLIMEYAVGRSLRSLLDEAKDSTSGRLPLRNMIDIARDIVAALCYAHRHGVVHRDIKPENVMVGDVVKLMDFGIAKIVHDPSITLGPGVMGTPTYMPPEQALGRETDERSDLYSLGILLYEMVSGRPPFSPTDEMSVVAQHVQLTPTAPSLHNPAVPRRLDRLILRMLAKEPDRRPTLADDVLQELTVVAGELSQADTPAEAPTTAGPTVRNDRVEALLGIPLFSSIPPDDLCDVAGHLAERHYRKGQIIFHKDDTGSTFHMIRAGSVQISVPSDRGEDIVLALLGSGDFFGELALLDESPRSATVTATEGTRTLALERQDFLDFLTWHPGVAIRILAALAQRVRVLNTQLEGILCSSPQTRVAESLLKLVDNFGSERKDGWDITGQATPASLAHMSGSTIQTVNKLLRGFHQAGILSRKQRRLIVHRPDELRRISTTGICHGRPSSR